MVLLKRHVSIVLIFIALSGVFVTGFVWYNWQNQISGNINKGGFGGIGNSSNELKQRVDILLIGADQRPNEGEKFNTDSLIMASIDPQSKRLSLLSIPRDTRVTIPGYPNIKINSVSAQKDLETLQTTVSELTGVPLSGYVLTNFNGFKAIIDTLGGITVNVEKDMYYETGDEQDGYINLRKGMQRLDGTKALQYARFRHDALADISRTARQQVILKAVAKEMFQLSTLPKLPKLIPDLMKAVQTNLNLNDLLKLAKAAISFDSTNVIAQTLPGKFADINGISYWEVDPKDAKRVVQNLLQGITTYKVIEEQEVDLLKPVVVTPSKPLPKVPGNPSDPNGRKSSGYKDFQVELSLSSQTK